MCNFSISPRAPTCALGFEANSPNYSISLLKALMHLRSNFMDYTGHVATEDGGPLLDEDSSLLHVAIQRVDGDGNVTDDEFVGTGGRHRCFAHLQGTIGFVEPRGSVRLRFLVSFNHT